MKLLLKTDALAQLQAHFPYNKVENADVVAKLAGTWVEVETEHLFDDQFNIVEGNLRVFDCMVAEIDNDNRYGKSKCGYCGFSHIHGDDKCPQCRDKHNGIIEEIVEHTCCEGCGAGKPGKVRLETTGRTVKTHGTWFFAKCSQCGEKAAHINRINIHETYPPKPYPEFKPVNAVGERQEASDARLRKYNEWLGRNAISMTVKPTMLGGKPVLVEDRATYHYDMLKTGGLRLLGTFTQSKTGTELGHTPNCADVLECVVSDAQCYDGAPTIEEFLREFGGTRAGFLACRKTSRFFAKACGAEELQKLAELES